MELLRSLSSLVLDILRQFLYWMPTLLLDTTDSWERFIRPFLQSRFGRDVELPPDLLFVLFLIGIALAIVKSYHKLRLEKLEKDKEIGSLLNAKPSIIVLPEVDGDCLRVINNGAEGKFTAKAQMIYESQPEGEVWFIKWANSLEKEQVIPRGDFSILEVASYESEIVYTNDHPRRTKPFIRIPSGRRVVSKEGTQETQIFDRNLSPKDTSIQIEVRIFSSPEMRSPFKRRYLLGLGKDEDIVSIKEIPTETSNGL